MYTKPKQNVNAAMSKSKLDLFKHFQ